jgi:hypothetical protein
MTQDDIKLTIMNALTMFITFTNVEAILKIVLLIVSIFYTILKTKEMIKSNKSSNNDL